MAVCTAACVLDRCLLLGCLSRLHFTSLLSPHTSTRHCTTLCTRLNTRQLLLGGVRVDTTWCTRSPDAAWGRYPTLGRPHPPPPFRGAHCTFSRYSRYNLDRAAAAPPARCELVRAVNQVDALAPAGSVRRPPPPPGLVGRASCCELALFFITGRRRLASV